MNDDDDGQQRRRVNPTLVLSAGAPPPPPFPPTATFAPATAAAAYDDEGEALPAAAVAATAPIPIACHRLDVLQVGEVWRRGLQGLAQSLKCPICLGYVVIPRYFLFHSHPSMPLPSIVCVLIMIDTLITSVF